MYLKHKLRCPDKYTIRKDIPIPPKGGDLEHGAPLKYPWPDMKVGDSILVKGRGTVCAGIKWAERNDLDWKFCTSREEDGHRIWRIK